MPYRIRGTKQMITILEPPEWRKSPENLEGVPECLRVLNYIVNLEYHRNAVPSIFCFDMPKAGNFK